MKRSFSRNNDGAVYFCIFCIFQAEKQQLQKYLLGD